MLFPLLKYRRYYKMADVPVTFKSTQFPNLAIIIDSAMTPEEFVRFTNGELVTDDDTVITKLTDLITHGGLLFIQEPEPEPEPD
jgi:hypothetical protein